MKTTEKRKFVTEHRQNYRNFIYFTIHEEGEKQMNNQRFVVPWQMVEPEKNKYLVE